MEKDSGLALSEQSESNGYTLIELLIVITIIGVLMVVVLAFNFQQQMKKARDGKRKAEIEQVRGALEMCKSDTGSYPVDSALVFGTTTTLTCGSPANTYLNPLPDDPQAPALHYTYTTPGCIAPPCTTYTLTATLEIPAGGTYTGTPLGSQ